MALAVVLSVFGVGPDGGVVAVEECVDGWHPAPVTQGLLADMEPNAGAVLGGQPAWVVGLTTSRAEDEGDRDPIIGAWRDGAWVRVKGPWRAFGSLNAVAATSPANAWTVGTRGVYNGDPIVGRWNGTSWKKVPVPEIAAQRSTFVDMVLLGPSKFWVAGAKLVQGRLRPLAMLRKAGGGWRKSSPPLDAAAEGGLNAVTVAPGGRVWAGGWRSDANGQGRPWVVYRSGSKWKTSPLAPVPDGRAALLDLFFSAANDGWAAGYVEGIDGYRAILQHWNGTAWSVVSLPWAVGESYVLHTVGVAGDGRLIVGGFLQDEYRRDLLAVLDGGTWTVTHLSPGTSHDNRERSAMTDIIPMGSGAMIVGYHDALPVTLIPCAGGSTARTTSPQLSSSGKAELSLAPAADVSDDVAPGRPVGAALTPTAVSGIVARDVTSEAGIDLFAPTWGGQVGDFTGDGLPDIFIGRHFQVVPAVLVNSPAHVFHLLDAPNFVRRDRHGCDAADVDDDGALDMFCTIGVNKGTSNTPQELMLNVGDGGGSWATREFGVLDGYGRGRNATFINLNKDQYPDLYVTNEPSRSDGQWSSNRLYMNVAGDHFESIPAWGMDISLGGSCVTAADLDGDGDDELLLCATEARGYASGARIFFNTGSALIDRTQVAGITPAFDRDVEVADFNGDSRPDIAFLATTQLRLFLQKPNGDFEPGYQLSTNAAVGIALGDVNGDDRPDIYLARRYANNMENYMLVNDGTGTGFTPMTIPQPGAGKIEDVLAIDYDGNGLTDFLTLNGAGTLGGPIKLTAFFAE